MGKYLEEGLEFAGITKEEVEKKLYKKGVKSGKELFFAACDEAGNIYGQLYNGGEII